MAPVDPAEEAAATKQQQEDEVLEREGLETELMDKEESEVGEDIDAVDGDPTP
ncbi:MAG TPA: hypothetical protein VF045_04120 [Acidimicrobiales bacterium]